MRIPLTAVAAAIACVAAAPVAAQQLQAAPARDRLIAVIGNLALDMNPAADKCYNKDSDTLVEVPCPDVIVAKPDDGGDQSTRQIAGLIARGEVIPRTRVADLGTQVPIAEGTYNCYNEDPPNSGNFVRVQCPDVIVIETND